MSTPAHVDKSTLTVSVNVPEHVNRTATPTFERTRKLLIEREQDRCFICGRTPTEVGAPHEAHHCLLEWCLSDAVDWNIIKSMCESEEWGWTEPQRLAAKAFDWSAWDLANPTQDQVTSFVDDMTLNGLLLCKCHHVGSGTGIHMMDHPRWIAQKFIKDGYVLINGDSIGSESERLQEDSLDK